MIAKFVLTQRYYDHPAGTVLYEGELHDYGCASEDTRDTGVEHISVTLKETGDYPYFTIPLHLLEQVA